MELTYKVNDRPPFGKTLVFALQQLLAILAATIAVPAVVNGNLSDYGLNMSQSAALFGAGVGTIVYLLFTKSKSPVFLGSSFAFIGSMTAAFSGAVANGVLYESLGYIGLIIGALVAGLVYVVISFIVKLGGVKWIDKLMPPVVIGPTVALIGLSLATSAIKSLVSYADVHPDTNAYIMTPTVLIGLLCGLATLAVVIICSVFGKKMTKMIPFILGIVVGYGVASIFTAFGWIFHNDALKIVDFTVFAKLSEPSSWYPAFTFVKAFGGEYGDINIGGYIGTVVVAYAPVAFVVFAEHIADHKNLSSIIDSELLEDPGLHRTLLGDGVGSVAGALFGGCPNTTYGESVGCVAISGNASISTIWTTAIMCIAVSFVAPFVLFLGSIPNCVMGGVCVALYGFIAVSGLKMVQKCDLGDNRNLFVVSTILITGIGGMALQFGKITVTNIAVALILGILANLLCSIGKNRTEEVPATEEVSDEVTE